MCLSRGHRVLLFSQLTRMLDIVQDYMEYRGRPPLWKPLQWWFLLGKDCLVCGVTVTCVSKVVGVMNELKRTTTSFSCWQIKGSIMLNNNFVIRVYLRFVFLHRPQHILPPNPPLICSAISSASGLVVSCCYRLRGFLPMYQSFILAVISVQDTATSAWMALSEERRGTWLSRTSAARMCSSSCSAPEQVGGGHHHPNLLSVS